MYRYTGITPKTPSGGHASLGTTQQSQELTLTGTESTECALKCNITKVT